MSRWRTSSFSAGGNCVEVAAHGGDVDVRHSEDREHVLRFTPAEWRAFLAGVRAGEFDDLAEL